jgi:hypothetical protein
VFDEAANVSAAAGHAQAGIFIPSPALATSAGDD